MKTIKPKIKRLIGLAMAFCLLLTTMQAVLLISANASDLPDNLDIRMPDITTENGLLWYKLDEAKGPAKNSIPGGAVRDSVEFIGDFRPEGGVDGGAVQFNGAYHHISINKNDDKSDLFLKDAYTQETVSFWYKPDTLNGIQMLYAQGGKVGGIAVRLNEGKMQVSISTATPTILDDVTVSDSLGKWTHVAVVFENSTASVYVNGEFKTSKATSNPAMGITGVGTTVGNNHTRANAWDDGSNTRDYKGMIDDLRIYKTAVTPQIVVREFSGYEDKEVLKGTAQAALNLPNSVTAHLSSSQSVPVPVSWTSEPLYDGDTPGVYVFTAALDLQKNMIAGGLDVKATITVKDDDGKEDPELNAAVLKAAKALADFSASQSTTAQEILDAVVASISNTNISAKWEATPVITTPQGVAAGSITGKIILTKGKYEATVDVDIVLLSLEDGLRVRYEFEDGKAADLSGNGRDGESYGTLKEADGVNGKAMYFSGGYVKMPEDVIQGLEKFTISVWIDPLSDFQYARVWDIGSSETNFVNLWLRDDTQRKYSCNIRLNETTTLRNTATNATFKTGTWRNLVVTYDESDKSRITIYEDGKVLVSTQTNKKLSKMGAATNALLGWAQTKNDYDYHGYMDDFRIYDRALTADEVGILTAEGTDSILKSTSDKLDIAAFNGFNHLTGVVQNLSLPKASDILDSGAAISWKSSDTAVISDSGVIASVNADSTATLTATLTRDGNTVTRSFPLTVKADRTINPDPVPSVVTVPGLYPDLPTRISANDGKASTAVTWDTPDPKQYAGEGSFTLNGTAAGKAVTVKVKVDSTLFTNPIIGPAAPDPFLYYKDGDYYYIRTSYAALTVSKAKRLQDIGQVPRVVVYSQEEAPTAATKNWWAPEIHFLDDNWYIYWAANDGKSENHRMYVLESTDPNDAQAPYVMKGKLAPTKENAATGEWEVDAAQDMWAIDGTVFENKDGRRYFLWAGYDGSAGNFQKLFIAEMLNPWTLKGSRTLISEPDQPFEIRGGGYKLNEGPQVVAKGNKVHVLYSACQANYDWYSLGLLSADADANLLNAASWTKNPGPVFTKSNNSDDESFATGHAMVVQSPDGTEDWLIYHAYQAGNQTNHMGDMEERCARAVRITWNGDMPVFGNPVPYDVLQMQPSGTADAVALKYEAETATLSGSARVASRPRASGRKVVENIDKNSSVTFKVDVPVAGRYLVSLMANSRTESGTTGYQNLNVNGTVYKILNRGNNAGNAGKFMPSCLVDNQRVGTGLYAVLPKGESTITVTYHPDAGAPSDVDYLYLLLDDIEYKVSLDKNSMTLQEGETGALTATVEPSGAAVSWSSSNAAVATVDQTGKVTAIAAGTAVIAAELPDGSKAECTVTVEKKPVQYTISLDKKTMALEEGKTGTLKATASPAGAAVSWSSSDESVATVDQTGKVTAIVAGTAVITAKLSDGSKAECTVTVTKEPIKYTIRLDKEAMTLEESKSGTLTAIVSPVGADVSWSSSNTAVATVDENGKVTAVSAGIAVITAELPDGSTVMCTVTITAPDTSSKDGSSSEDTSSEDSSSESRGVSDGQSSALTESDNSAGGDSSASGSLSFPKTGENQMFLLLMGGTLVISAAILALLRKRKIDL